MRVSLCTAGLIILALTAAYPLYPKRFGWRRELERVSPLTRDIFFVHCGFIVLLLALQAVLFLALPHALMEQSTAATALLAGLTAFWAYRLIAQLFLFDRRLWLGNRFNTIVHVVFTVLWCYLSGVCGWALWRQFA